MTARKKPAPSLRDYLLLAEMDRADGLRAERDALADLLREAREVIDRFQPADYDGGCDCHECNLMQRIDAMLAELGKPKGGRK